MSLAMNNIYLMDTLEGLKQIPDKSVNLILTDPPYVISRESNYHRGNTGILTSYNLHFGDWDLEPLPVQELLTEFYRILKDGGTLIMFYDCWKMQEVKEAAEKVKFKQPRLGFWEKTNPVPANGSINYLNTAREYFASFVKKGKPTFNSKYDKANYFYPICAGKERTAHPTQKPLQLMIDLILKHSNENDVVFDGFIGSGTTCVAAIETGRQYIGFENDEGYFAIADKRIEKAKNGGEDE